METKSTCFCKLQTHQIKFLELIIVCIYEKMYHDIPHSGTIPKGYTYQCNLTSGKMKWFLFENHFILFSIFQCIANCNFATCVNIFLVKYQKNKQLTYHKPPSKIITLWLRRKPPLHNLLCEVLMAAIVCI